MNDQDKHDTRELYLLTFDNFASSTRELADSLELKPRRVYTLMKAMAGDLVCDEMQDSADGPVNTEERNVGMNILWQCFDTYDYIERIEAVAKIDAWLAKKG